MKAYVQRVEQTEGASFVYRVKADPRFARGWHCHPEYELTLIQASQGRRFVGDSIENYRAGDLILLGPDLPHTWRSEEAIPGTSEIHRAVVIQFGRDFLGREFFRAPELREIGVVLGRAGRGLSITGSAADEVSRRMVGMRKLDRLDRLLELLALMQCIAEGGSDLREICRFRSPAPEAKARRRIDQVISHLNESYAAKISQERVAEMVGMTPAAFCRFFKRTTGTTFLDYLSELRVSRACNLLIDSNDTIRQISIRAGFQNLSNFNRRFLRQKKMTPREYRQRHRALDA